MTSIFWIVEEGGKFLQTGTTLGQLTAYWDSTENKVYITTIETGKLEFPGDSHVYASPRA